MKRILGSICTLIIPALQLYAQDDFFTNISLGKNFNHKNWTYNTSGVWKHIYNDIGWSRIGFNGSASYKYNGWTLLGGMTVQHTFDKEIVNSIELRP